MRKSLLIQAFLLLLLVPSLAADRPAGYENNWHQWRGPLMTGFVPKGAPPLKWSETENIRWKVEIPGRGHATPIIWGDRIFIQTSVPMVPEPAADSSAGGRQGRGMPSRNTSVEHRFMVLCLNRADGKVLWRKVVNEEKPKEATHDLGSWASNSPVTDGEHVYAYFGSRGLFCLDMEGRLIWERDFGQMEKRMQFGEGASPALYGDTLIILWDHEGDSFIFALDKKTGEEKWKAARDERTSWSTPNVVEVDGKPQVITSATNRIRGYDLETGELIWECGGLTANVIPVPVESGGILIAASGFRGNALLAIKLSGARGDITGTEAVLWKLDRDTPYTPSALIYEDMLYLLRSNNGILSCFNIRTGEEYYSRQRLEGLGSLYTSPVGADGKVYILGQKGTMYVIRFGPEFEILARNTLEDSFHASPAVVGNQMFLRGFRYLYCIEAE
jgi:outer membrane protein assembly factor BamB